MGDFWGWVFFSLKCRYMVPLIRVSRIKGEIWHSDVAGKKEKISAKRIGG